MTPELIIFDCDGVLVDTETITNTIIADNLGRYGLNIHPDEAIHMFAGGTMASVGEEALRRGADLPDGWLDAIYQEIFDALGQGVDVIDGLPELLDLIETAGIPKAIASNGPVAKMQVTLRPSGLWGQFEGAIYSGHDHGPKPAPDMLQRIMADFGIAPAQTVMIDDMRSGCLSAQAAGVTCFGYVAEGDPGRIDGTGARPVTSMAEIAQALGLA